MDDSSQPDANTTTIWMDDDTFIPPPSAYVDYTPRHIPPDTPSRHTNDLGLIRQRRALHYRQLALQSPARENYMDSPMVRRELGVNPSVIPINIDEPRPTRPLAFEKYKVVVLLSIINPVYYRKKEWTISDFDVGKHLGQGKFGNVYLAREKLSRQPVALKILIKKDLEQANVAKFLKREVEIHCHLRHPSILRMYGYFQDEHHIYLVLDCAHQGSLYGKLEKRGRFDEMTTRQCIYQLANALTYLQKHGIIHRDIKPENILVDAKGKLKLADFGWAVHDRRPRRTTFCGTLDYLPPEMIENKTHNAKVDVWALGILAYELLVGKPPFEHAEYIDTYQHIVKVNFTFPDHVSSVARDFISLALQYDIRKRSHLSELVRHPWLQKDSIV